MTHDPLCPQLCQCDLIAKVREDMRYRRYQVIYNDGTERDIRERTVFDCIKTLMAQRDEYPTMSVQHAHINDCILRLQALQEKP
jgi:hypothetical protein